MDVGLVGKVFEIVGEALSSYIELLPSLFSGVVNVFYNAETGFTFVGIITLMTFGIGITKWAFNLVRDLIKL